MLFAAHRGMTKPSTLQLHEATLDGLQAGQAAGQQLVLNCASRLEEHTTRLRTDPRWQNHVGMLMKMRVVTKQCAAYPSLAVFATKAGLLLRVSSTGIERHRL